MRQSPMLFYVVLCWFMSGGGCGGGGFASPVKTFESVEDLKILCACGSFNVVVVSCDALKNTGFEFFELMGEDAFENVPL